MAYRILENEPLLRHTGLRIGGPARRFIEARGEDEFIAALRDVHTSGELWIVLGAGSNVLVADRGFEGAVIHPIEGSVRIEGTMMCADAAVPIARVVAETVEAGCAGLEWAVGIPGTVAGSIVGNAGCFGGEMRNVVQTVSVFDMERGELRSMKLSELGFGYRESVFKHRPELVVVSAVFGLKRGDRASSRMLIRTYAERRIKGQDIGSQTAGCAFKNIPWDRIPDGQEAFMARFPDFKPSGTVHGISAGFLVDQLGLKGLQIGGAKISERHGNFIVNTGNATAADVRSLMTLMSERIVAAYGITLEEEIRCIGFDKLDVNT